MGIKSLIQLAAALAMLAASSGKLPEILKRMHIVQLRLLQDSMASGWSHARLNWE
jgi:hypothetical protein